MDRMMDRMMSSPWGAAVVPRAIDVTRPFPADALAGGGGGEVSGVIFAVRRCAG